MSPQSSRCLTEIQVRWGVNSKKNTQCKPFAYLLHLDYIFLNHGLNLGRPVGVQHESASGAKNDLYGAAFWHHGLRDFLELNRFEDLKVILGNAFFPSDQSNPRMRNSQILDGSVCLSSVDGIQPAEIRFPFFGYFHYVFLHGLLMILGGNVAYGDSVAVEKLKINCNQEFYPCIMGLTNVWIWNLSGKFFKRRESLHGFLMYRFRGKPDCETGSN